MLDLALRSMDEGLMLVNGEGQIKAWNENALKTFKIDDETIHNYRHLQDQIAKHRAGDTVKIEVSRNDESVFVELTFGQRPDCPTTIRCWPMRIGRSAIGTTWMCSGTSSARRRRRRRS